MCRLSQVNRQLKVSVENVWSVQKHAHAEIDISKVNLEVNQTENNKIANEM